MQRCERHRSRKALAALVGFVLRGSAGYRPEEVARQSGLVRLVSGEGSERNFDVRVFRLALQRGLIQVRSAPDGGHCCTATPEGRSAIRRWLADPDSAFQDQHRTLSAGSDPEHGHLRINTDESPLTALARLKDKAGAPFLDPEQLTAGERLRADFTRGHMQPSLGQSWEPVRYSRQQGAAGGAADLGEAALAARLRVEAALAEVGPELSGVLLDVCCFLKGLTQVERERQWPARSAKLMLRTALASLARHHAAPRGRISRRRAPPRHVP